MAKTEYEWVDSGSLPEIAEHSEVKHSVIVQYLKQYVKVLTINPSIPNLNLHIVDGFSGGGRYYSPKHKREVYGSPILLHNTIREVEAEINTTSRTKTKLSVNAQFYFIEKKKPVYQCLKDSLCSAGIDINSENIHIINKSFTDAIDPVINSILTHGRGDQRAIYLLDQYGYTDVPIPYLRYIFGTSGKNSEAILTFSTDSIINYLSDSPSYLKGIKKAGLHEVLSLEAINDLKELKQVDSKQTRALIEQSLYDFVWKKSKARFFTPFFIRSDVSNRSYWLVHLSNHPKARDEMVKIHWSFQNSFAHYGGPGLKMLFGFDANLSHLENQLQFDFLFDESAESRTRDALLEGVTEYFSDEPLEIFELISSTCNGSPAHYEQYLDAIYSHLCQKGIKIIGKNGEQRRSRKSLRLDDKIVLERNLTFMF
ncbi:MULTISPECIES: three-Cys-motif partner protein TcmP [Aliagarivorans]|uniref:three-Cys-motif partner protein TcmP n=1 Tax=Aliagarivorans TaxID=882379 RepID=UPI00041E0AFE|nr:MULTISPECIES: three-Cys-motif partner protein TcmP [Aliagarivorans]